MSAGGRGDATARVRVKRRVGRAAGRASLVVGALIVALVVATAAVSLVWTPCDPSAMTPLARFAGPSAAHPFGCDQFGRDVLSRVMAGARPAVLAGVASVTVGAAVGCALGMAAGMAGPGARSVVMRVMDGLMAFPGVLLALMLALVIGRGLVGTLVAVAVFTVPTFARLCAALTLAERGRPYVAAARSYGRGAASLALTQILPNILPRLVTQLTSSAGVGILLEASLSFLGLGVQPPQASWGVMVSEAMQYVYTYPTLVVAPGCVLVVAVLGFNLLGDGLDGILQEGGEGDGDKR
ncbi:ABC transporter permease [bacterium]|nr:ABC transporter permease [bacterium]